MNIPNTASGLKRVKICLLAAVVCALIIGALAHRAQLAGSAGGQPVGLSLFFRDGAAQPITLAGDAPRYLQEIDIVATVPTQGDQGIEPLIQNSELSSLDWSGVEMVEEDWRAAGDGTFIRQRFYRNARWMEKPSLFLVTPTDDRGRPVGLPFIANAGKDDLLKSSDDGFVRRFVVRQVAFGCPSQSDCSGASFIVQGLVQLRDALNPQQGARRIPSRATRLELRWTEQPHASRTVQVSHASPSAFPYGYGFQPSIEALNPPANGSHYVRGEMVQFRVTFRDKAGNRLHPEGSLPTYGQFLRGEIPSGLRYYNGFALFPTLYYALKHREGLMAVALLGPTDRLKTARTTVGGEEFATSQSDFATTAVDGYTSIFANIPPTPIVFGGDPNDNDTPVSDIVPITIPEDALPGTYVATLKSRREWGGEALNRAVTIEIQVGTPTPTTFVAKTGRCDACHTGSSSLPNLLHGLNDRRTCFSCHSSLAFEPDAAIDIRAHVVHDRSDRFNSLANINNCAKCHLTPPDGPARGLLGN
jgi:predicted CXXCH cytochrome family protein